jgi:signal transduction histidine kinase
VTVDHDDRWLTLTVRDTGVGIPEDERELIFEKFRQGTAALGADQLTREHSGTGLGLSITRELCILLGGKIELESEVGKGSQFRVTLPIVLTEPSRPGFSIEQRIDEIARRQRTEHERIPAESGTE